MATETISIANLPTWTPSTDDILVFVDRADWITKQTPASDLPNIPATDVTYDNTTSLLSATNTQQAIDELASEKANDSGVVHDTGNETIAGVKTFSSSPIVPTPTTATQAVNKEYADYTPDFYKYSIVTSVASWNLTAALKNYEGNDPTPTKPVKIQIGDVVRSITSSFSFMLNAWTNWFNSGSAELATKEIDYFGYIRYSPGGLSLIISRCPNANIVSDFSASGTYTNEKYACDSNGTTYLTTDPVVNIGRFNATLSAGGAYTWSIPATSVIINNPTYDTRDLDITMSSTWAVVSSWDYAKYKIVWNTVYMEFRWDGKSITGSWPITHKLPFNMKNIWMWTTCQIYDWTQWLLPLTGWNEIFKTINAGNWSWTETWVSIRANKQYFI